MPRPTQQEIDEWNARMAEPEGGDDDFEVEIYTPEGHGARVPYRKARKYLQQNFGIDLDEMERPEGAAGPDGGASIADPPGNAATRPSQRYFGKQPPK